LQTSIRSLTGSSAIAILISSALFVILHQPHHWLALMALSYGLGYAYERSGSLLRPILMHIFFNGFSVTLTLISAP
ncbi:MAG: lysostaphin resistance A-like protein, partial [Planctomycetota bacterium]